MNLPEVFLVEPYNAYAPKGRKKHWHEVIEEQALLARILAEQAMIHEASNRNVNLPPNSPSPSIPTVGAAAGAGGSFPPQVFHPTDAVVQFSRTPANGPGPVTVQFTNLTINPELYTYLWTFGDGTTSTAINPSHIYESGSSASAIYTASLQATSSVFGVPAAVSSNLFVSASIPVVSVAFTLGQPATLTASFYTASAPATIPFTNGSTMDNGTSLTYSWQFGSGSNATSSLANPSFTFTATGSYTVLLGATGSYGIMGSGTRKIQIIT